MNPAGYTEDALVEQPAARGQAWRVLDRNKVKATARALLSTLKQSKLVLDWRKHQQTRADVKVTIQRLLDEGLPSAYTPELFEQKSAAIFQHIYDGYFGAGRSVYAGTA